MKQNKTCNYLDTAKAGAKNCSNLLSWLALEAQVWLHDEFDLLLLQTCSQGVEILNGKRDAKVWHRHIVSVHCNKST
jgi:hypothetical protein